MQRHLTKACCGGKGYVFELDSPVSKTVLSAFQEAGFTTAESYTRIGVFFVKKDGLTCNGPFGGTKMQVRCGGTANCSQLLDHLENTFKMVCPPPVKKQP
jgi:hypothetical protein